MKQTTHHPKDLCMDEAVRFAEQAIMDAGGPRNAQVFFKFTCAKCGKRQHFERPNCIYTNGQCEACGTVTEITHYSVSLMAGRACASKLPDLGHAIITDADRPRFEQVHEKALRHGLFLVHNFNRGFSVVLADGEYEVRTLDEMDRFLDSLPLGPEAAREN